METLAYFSSLEEYDSENTEINIHYVKDGDEIEVSKKISLRAIHTPGHTNGSISFLIKYANDTDGKKSTEDLPNYSYLFTGET